MEVFFGWFAWVGTHSKHVLGLTASMCWDSQQACVGTHNKHVLGLTASNMVQALETRIQKNIAKKGDSIKLKPVSAQKVSAHKSHQSPTK